MSEPATLPAPLAVTGLEIPGTKIHLSKIGAELADDLTFDDYLEIGEKLTLVGEAWQWWWGDYLNQGEHRFGEKYAQAVDDTGYAVGTIQNAASVASRIEISRRREELSFSHHAAVAYLDPEVQDRLLDQAVGDVWSVSRLREAVSTFKKALKNGGDLPPEKPKKKKNAKPDRAPLDEKAKAEYGDDPLKEEGVDPFEEIDRLEAEVRRLTAELESVTTTDEQKEIRKLHERVAGLEGRLAGETRTKNEAVRQIKYYQRLTANVRELLGVEQNNEIQGKLKEMAKLRPVTEAVPAEAKPARNGATPEHETVEARVDGERRTIRLGMELVRVDRGGGVMAGSFFRVIDAENGRLTLAEWSDEERRPMGTVAVADLRWSEADGGYLTDQVDEVEAGSE